MLETLFYKDAGVQVCNFIQKGLQHIFFPLNIAKFFRIACFIDLIWWLLFQVEQTINGKTVLWSY